MNKLIGREYENKELDRCIKNTDSQLIVVYGRRRIGKTYLITNYFNNSFCFSLTGIYNQPAHIQLFNFISEYNERTGSDLEPAKNWMESFLLLKKYIGSLPENEKQVVFFDEMPWMDTLRSDFLPAFEWFWNSWGSKRKNLLFIVCGSATSWMVDNIDNNKGGLFNRFTCRLYLKPFTLCETEQYLESKGISWSRMTIAECYMIMGGIPFYLNMLDSSLNFHENIDKLFFKKQQGLWDEFKHLYQTLFKNNDLYIRIVEALSTKRNGMTRTEIIEQTGIPSNGTLSKAIKNLEYSGFVRSFTTFGKNKNNLVYQLADYYTAFYYHFIHNNPGIDEHYWSNSLEDQKIKAWSGLTFEQVCMDHLPQIKKKLGISGILSSVSTWNKIADEESPGAQIDLIIDRKDKIINLCEIKFANDEYVITKDYDMKLRSKVETFRRSTKTKSMLHPTMITTYGVKQNKYSSYILRQVILDDLFSPAT